jgi:signal transduction histidine kinase
MALAARVNGMYTLAFWVAGAIALLTLGGLLLQHRHLRRLRARLAETERMLAAAAAAQRRKSIYLAELGHELRNPLTGLIGMTSLLGEHPLTDLQRSCRDAIQESGQRLLVMLNDLLDISRIEAGRVAIEAVTYRPAEVIAACLHTVQPKAQAKQLPIRAELPAAGIPDTMVGDPLRTGQILINLLDNAVKFTDRGQVTLEVRLATDAGAAWLVCAVHDSGCGIAAERLAGIFEAFQTPCAGNSGSGLGLAISLRLARLMGGTLTAQSVPGQGSTFTLRLPAPAGKEDCPAPANRSASSPESTKEESSWT